MIMDFNRLRTFAAVAKIGSITQAAHALHVTQQAVSSQIQLLEQDLGVNLFKRANRRIYLTMEGQRIFNSVQIHFDQVEQEVLAVVQVLSAMDSKIIIGATNEVADILLAKPIAAFKKLHPNIQFELELNNDAACEQGVINGLLDMALVVFSKEVKLLSVTPFKNEQFITVASVEYLKDSKIPIHALKDLLQHDIIDFERDCPSLKTWINKNDNKLVDHFKYKTATVCANDDRLIRRFLLSHLGVANVPKSLVAEELNSGVLIEILPDLQSIQAGIDIIFMKHKTQSLAATTFINFLLQARDDEGI